MNFPKKPLFRSFQCRRTPQGQALVEMVLVLPLLLLLAAGFFQFTQLFLARIQFEHSCGVVAREWAAGLRGDSTLADGIWASLGPQQHLFQRASLAVERGSPRSTVGEAPRNLAGMEKLAVWTKNHVFDYGGSPWTVHIRCLPVPLFSRLFNQGILFTAHLGVLRHPLRSGRAP